MMAPGPFLFRRGAGLVFRRRVPRKHAAHFRSAFLRLPLDTHLLAEGRRRALRASALLDAAFALLEAGMGACELDAATIERIVMSLMRFELDAREDLRALAPPRGAAELEAALGLEAATRETLRAALIYNDYAAVEAPVAATLRRLGIAAPEGGAASRGLARRAARALIEVSDENMRREQGVYAEPAWTAAPTVAAGLVSLAAPLPPRMVHPAAPPETRLSAAPGQRASPPLPERVPAPASFAGPSSAGGGAAASASAHAVPVKCSGARSTQVNQPATRLGAVDHGSAPSLLAAGEEYIAEMTEAKGKSWAVNSAGNHRSSFTLLAEVHGDRPLGFFTRERMVEMNGVLRGTPKHHHKGHSGATIRELIAEADVKEAAERMILKTQLEASGADRGTIETTLAAAKEKRLKVATIYRHQQEIQRLFGWATEKGYVAANPMRGVIWTRKQLEAFRREESDGKRLPWGDKARDLFASRIFVDPLEDPFDPLFWAPLIASLAGLRQEEVLQLKTDDVDTIAGFPCFRIQQGEDQHLKNASARRIVPIHPSLIALGFLELVERRRRQGQDWLFPDQKRSAARNRLSGIFTKIFSAYRMAEGLYDPLRPFHSLRTDFNVVMKRAGVPLNARKALMGHLITDVTDVDYDPDGDPIAYLADCVAKIEFDHSGIRRPFAPAADAAASAPRLRLVSAQSR